MKRVGKVFGVLLAVVLFLSLFGETLIFDEKYISKIKLRDDFRTSMKSDMRFIALDYMNDSDISKCQDLYLALKANVSKLKIITPYGMAEDSCDPDVLKGLFADDSEGPFELYDMGELGTLISASNKNGFKLYRYFDVKSCSFDYDTRYKNLLATIDSMILNVDDRYYLISEWHSKYRYVFYYMDKSPQFNEINCRFDII